MTPGPFLLAAMLAGVQQASTKPAESPIEGELPSLGGATGWLNSSPLTAAALRGKVVLIDFWTYTCINWLPTLPYTRAWAEKYRDQGLRRRRVGADHSTAADRKMAAGTWVMSRSRIGRTDIARRRSYGSTGGRRARS